MSRLFCKNVLGNFSDFFGVVSGFIADLVCGDVTMVTGSNLLAGGLEVRVALVVTGPRLLWGSGVWFWACVEAFSPLERLRLLGFATAMAGPPAGGAL